MLTTARPFRTAARRLRPVIDSYARRRKGLHDDLKAQMELIDEIDTYLCSQTALPLLGHADIKVIPLALGALIVSLRQRRLGQVPLWAGDLGLLINPIG